MPIPLPEFVLLQPRPDLHVQEAEYARLLGFPRHRPLEGRSRELADWARRWFEEHGQPWISARGPYPVTATPTSLLLAELSLASPRLQQHWSAAGVDRALLLAVSAGPECETQAAHCWQLGHPDEYFFLEIFASAVVEHLMATANGHLCAWAESQNLAALPHESPGYSDWPVSEQTALEQLMRRAQLAFPGELAVLPSGMLRPKKSQLAIIGLTPHRHRVAPHSPLVPCTRCPLSNCSYRRAPYRHAPPRLEQVAQSLPQPPDTPPAPPHPPSPLTLNAPYHTNPRALRKWAAERLQLEPLRDGSLQARFRYEGTTCSNLGRPLIFDYFVTLRPASELYRNYSGQNGRERPGSGD